MLTITQATDINTVCRFLFEDSDPLHPNMTERPTEQALREAMAALAEHASKALGAGWHRRKVTAAKLREASHAIELEVRTRPSPFMGHIGPAVAGYAYESGWMNGWRGRPFRAVYTRSHESGAEASGYSDGKRESLAEIAKEHRSANERARTRRY